MAAAIEAGEIFTLLLFLLEAGYSARSGSDYASILDGLLALPGVEIDAEVEQRAVDAQRELARTGHHRLPPVDLLVAAIAARHGLGILHYDADYDVLSKHKTYIPRIRERLVGPARIDRLTARRPRVAGGFRALMRNATSQEVGECGADADPLRRCARRSHR